eukprot:6251250-Amphidinium_carterae.3
MATSTSLVPVGNSFKRDASHRGMLENQCGTTQQFSAELITSFHVLQEQLNQNGKQRVPPSGLPDNRDVMKTGTDGVNEMAEMFTNSSKQNKLRNRLQSTEKSETGYQFGLGEPSTLYRTPNL